jgi:hypothetical protein
MSSFRPDDLLLFCRVPPVLLLFSLYPRSIYSSRVPEDDLLGKSDYVVTAHWTPSHMLHLASFEPNSSDSTSYPVGLPQLIVSRIKHQAFTLIPLVLAPVKAAPLPKRRIIAHYRPPQLSTPAHGHIVAPILLRQISGTAKRTCAALG